MKFRGVMIDAGPMREFTNIVSTISKISKECVLRLAEDQLYFIVSDENSGPAPPILWCEIPQAMYFSEYQMVGLDDEHKDIYLGFSSVNLARSLVTTKTAKSLKIKLTKKQCPCLTLEIETNSVLRKLLFGFHSDRDAFAFGSCRPFLMPPHRDLTQYIRSDDINHLLLECVWNSDLRRIMFGDPGRLYNGQPSPISQQTRHVTHDIPVAVIPRKMWTDFQEPRVLQPDISIELPPLKQLRTTIDRMRTMASEVVIRASAEGRLTLQISTDMAKVSTRFKDLRVEAFAGAIDHSDSETETQNEDISRVCHCRVDAKKFSIFLSADQISHNRTVCSIVHKKLVILCLQTEENVKLQCFINGIVF